MADDAGYDALLVVGFGGPEGPDDVLPFLENVTRGRSVPPARLAEVAAHYAHFGGVSPLNAQLHDLTLALRKSLAERGPDLSVYWGNRNWHPYLADTLRAMRDDGVGRVLALVTSPYSSYSGCRQYREDLAAARAEVGPGAPVIDKIRQFYDHPGFIDCFVRSTVDALELLGPAERASARLVFAAHSLPLSLVAHSGPDPARGTYVEQLRETARLVADRVAVTTGRFHAWSIAFQSRSGPPTQPWLEPDVAERISTLNREGASGVVVVPIGFVSDHIEVLWDLDVVAAGRAAELGLPFRRAATPGSDPVYIDMVRELVLERLGPSTPRRAMGRIGPSWDTCALTCCLPVRGEPKPTVGDTVPT